jgi:hypothetical protein
MLKMISSREPLPIGRTITAESPSDKSMSAKERGGSIPTRAVISEKEKRQGSIPLLRRASLSCIGPQASLLLVSIPILNP